MPVEQATIVRTLIRDRAKLLAYIWSIVHDGHTAEDILQEVSVVAVEKRETIESEAVLFAWLRTAARHRALDAVRAQSKQPLTLDESTLDLLETEWAATDDLGADLVMDALRHCLEELSPSARQVIDLRYREALGSQEIAERLNRSLAAVYKTTTRAHAALADCVKGQINDD